MIPINAQLPIHKVDSIDLLENCASSGIAVAITALMGGLVIAPVTQQSAEAQFYGGLKSTSAPAGSELLTLVGHGGGGGHFGGGHMGGGHMGGGHMGGNHWAGGGGGHWGGGETRGDHPREVLLVRRRT